MSPVRLVSIIARTLLLAVLSQAADTQCYAPNGTATNWSSVGDDLRIYACPPGDDGFATCCVGGDFCHPDNLCYNLHDGYPVVHRQYCTDPTWESTNCSPLCRDDQDVRAPSDGATPLTPCSDGKFCCGLNNDDCCSSHSGSYAVAGVKVGEGITFSTASTASKTSATPTAISTSTSSVETKTTTQPESQSAVQQDPSLGGAAIAGIVVGSCVCTGLVTAIITAVFLRRNQARQKADGSSEYTTSLTQLSRDNGVKQHELHNNTRRTELPIDTWHELGS